MSRTAPGRQEKPRCAPLETPPQSRENCPALSRNAQSPIATGSDCDCPCHYRNAPARNPGLLNPSAAFVGGGVHQAWTAHLGALGDSQSEREIRLRPQTCQQPDEGDIGTAGRRVLQDPVQGGEHAGPDIDAVAAVTNVKVDAGDA